METVASEGDPPSWAPPATWARGLRGQSARRQAASPSPSADRPTDAKGGMDLLSTALAAHQRAADLLGRGVAAPGSGRLNVSRARDVLSRAGDRRKAAVAKLCRRPGGVAVVRADSFGEAR